MTVRKILLAAAAAALMSTPAWADPGHGNGNGKGNHGNGPGNPPGQSDKGNGHGHGRPEHPGNSHKCTVHNVGYVASGTLVNQTLTKDEGADTYSGKLEVEVTRANRHAAADKGKTVTYEVSKAHVSFDVPDANADGSVGLDDVVKGDRVHLIGRISALAKRCDQSGFTATTTIRKIVFHAPLPATHSKG